MQNNNSYKGYQVPIGHIWDAHYACLKHKRRTSNAMLFGVNLERNISSLWRDINNRTYTIGRSIAFIVEYPVKREIFAADFRDRVVHDWICLRLEPLFEEYLSPRMMSNRKGRGTLSAIYNAAKDIWEESEGYTRDCWIWKMDLQGFFMSIDKRLLNAKLQSFIDERYHAPDKEVLKWLTEKVIMHCPQKNCFRKSPASAWLGLRADKSLFTQDDWHGVPIGNLPSQLFATFLLCDAVRFMESRGFGRVTEYVDDFVIVNKSKDAILSFIPELRRWLLDNLGIRMHPKKFYLQHYTKGVSFVGGIIKPYRIYVSKRSRRRFFGRLRWMLDNGVPLNEMLPSVNSSLGSTKHFSGYKTRHKAMEMIFAARKDVYFTNNCLTMKAI